MRNRVAKRMTISSPAAIGFQTEMRASIRTHTIRHFAKVMTEADIGLCKVLNVSDGGVQIGSTIDLAVNQQIALAMSDRITLRARIVWREDRRFGATLREPIDSSTLLRCLADERAAADSRDARFETRLPALLTTAGRSFAIHLLDIAVRGMKIALPDMVAVQQPVTITLADGRSFEAIVRWYRDGHAGLELVQALQWRTLGSMRAFAEAATAAPSENGRPAESSAA